MNKDKGILRDIQTKEAIQGFVLDEIDDAVGGATDVSAWLAFIPETDVDITLGGNTGLALAGSTVWLRESTISLTFETGPTAMLIMHRG